MLNVAWTSLSVHAFAVQEIYVVHIKYMRSSQQALDKNIHPSSVHNAATKYTGKAVPCRH